MVAAGLVGMALPGSLLLLKICILFLDLAAVALTAPPMRWYPTSVIKTKGANLSLLGVFAIGALGMPLILGILEKAWGLKDPFYGGGHCCTYFCNHSFCKIPARKNTGGMHTGQMFRLMGDRVLLLIAFFFSFKAALKPWYITGSRPI